MRQHRARGAAAVIPPPSSRLVYLSQYEAELNAQFHAALKSLINAQPTAPYKFLAEHFAALDANSDKKLDFAEVRPFFSDIQREHEQLRKARMKVEL